MVGELHGTLIRLCQSSTPSCSGFILTGQAVTAGFSLVPKHETGSTPTGSVEAAWSRNLEDILQYTATTLSSFLPGDKCPALEASRGSEQHRKQASLKLSHVNLADMNIHNLEDGLYLLPGECDVESIVQSYAIHFDTVLYNRRPRCKLVNSATIS